jgi:hypothetical protein
MKKSVEIDPEVIAETAGLTYVSDLKPGFSRKLAGKHFKFYDLQGKKIKDPDEIDRMRKLAIRITKSNSKNTYKLNAEEKAVLDFLKKRLKKKPN